MPNSALELLIIHWLSDTDIFREFVFDAKPCTLCKTICFQAICYINCNIAEGFDHGFDSALYVATESNDELINPKRNVLKQL
jgi:hypothetical protein